MLVLEVFRYLKRRADKRPVRLSNFVSMENHHSQRSVEPKVSIIIPTRNKYELLRACIESIQTKTTYGNYEIVVINNDSSEASTIEYLELLRSSGTLVLDYPDAFNYAKITNFGADNTDSEYLCLLNNDTEVIEPSWLGNLVDHAVQPGVGIVGSQLLYPNGTLQHLGVALGFSGAAGHPFSGYNPDQLEREGVSKNCFETSAISFACALVSRSDFLSIGGLDEEFKVGLNDVDFSIRLKMEGHSHVLCCRSKLIHHESKSRRSMLTPVGAFRATLEVLRFVSVHGPILRRDHFFTREINL